jgi:hypothetical protein
MLPSADGLAPRMGRKIGGRWKNEEWRSKVVTVLGMPTGIQLVAAPIKAKQTVKVVIGKHPPKHRRVAAEAEQIIKNWYPDLAGSLGEKVDMAVEVRVDFINDPKGDVAWDLTSTSDLPEGS